MFLCITYMERKIPPNRVLCIFGSIKIMLHITQIMSDIPLTPDFIKGKEWRIPLDTDAPV